jgi:hypothetical protein
VSLLSDIQGRPHTVRTLLDAMKHLGGILRDDELSRWFLPGVFEGPDPQKTATRVRQALGCARSLGWVETERRSVHRLTDLEIPTSPAAFLDHLHATLCRTDKVEDRRILEAYAVVVLQIEGERTTDWLEDWTNDHLADFIDAALRGGRKDGERLFNKDKVPSWREWLEAIGLGWNSQTLGHFLPDPVVRLQRELSDLTTQFGVEQEIPPYDFLGAVGRRMPYLDRGEILNDISERMKRPLPTDQVSVVLARALRDLEQDGVIELVSRGDAASRGLRIPEVGVWPAKIVVGFILKRGAGV